MKPTAPGIKLDKLSLDHPAISPIPFASLRLLTHWNKVLFAVVGTRSKIIFDYVIRRLDALSAGLKNRLGA